MPKTKTKKDNENNVELEVNGSQVTFTVDLDTELRESESGKSTIVAVQEGQWQEIPDNEDYSFKLIVIKKKDKKKGK